MMDEHLSFRQQVIWDKGKMGMGWQYRRSTECVLVATRGKGKMHWYDRSRRVENIIRPGDYGIKKIIPKAGDHPTPKPVSLASHFIRLHSRGRHLVLDPFLGGGSTAEAAIQRGRRFLGFELDREHYERSIDRCKRAIVAKRQSRIPREMVAA
jgi:DNA modification methylase